MTQRPVGLLFLVALLAGSLGALGGAHFAAAPPAPTPDPATSRRLEELEATVAELRARLDAIEAHDEQPAPVAVPTAPGPTPGPAAPPPARATGELAAELEQVRAAQAHEHQWRQFLLKFHLTDTQSNAVFSACAEAQSKRNALLQKRPVSEWSEDDERQMNEVTARLSEQVGAVLSPEQADGFVPSLCW